MAELEISVRNGVRSGQKRGNESDRIGSGVKNLGRILECNAPDSDDRERPHGVAYGGEVVEADHGVRIGFGHRREDRPDADVIHRLPRGFDGLPEIMR